VSVTDREKVQSDLKVKKSRNNHKFIIKVTIDYCQGK